MARRALKYRGVTTMATMLIALPVLPGKEEQARRYGREKAGPRRDESIAASKGIGVSREIWHLQVGPQGALLLASITTDDLPGAFQAYAASDSPFDRWEKPKVYKAKLVLLIEQCM